MNIIYKAAAFVPAILLVPMLASAQISDGTAGEFGTFLTGVNELITGFIVPVLISLAVLVFIYGVFKYFILGGGDEDAREQGKSLMLYAILGFAAIVALWGIVYFVVEAFGFDTTKAPTGPKGGTL